MTSKQIRKAVIPITGSGDHRLPASQGAAHPMLRAVGKSRLQYSVEEALDAGITELIFITGCIEHNCQSTTGFCQDVHAELSRQQKFDVIDFVLGMQRPTLSTIHVRQADSSGFSNLIIRAQDLLEGEYFALIHPENLSQNEMGVLKQMVDSFHSYDLSHPTAMLAIHCCTKDDQFQSNFAIGSRFFGRLIDAKQLSHNVPSPALDEAHRSAAGCYILPPSIFDHLEPPR